MARIEQMTAKQVQTVLRLASSSSVSHDEADALCQAIRVVRSQGDAIAIARRILDEPRPVDSAEARLASDLRDALTHGQPQPLPSEGKP